jgi:hypothetical protein
MRADIGKKQTEQTSQIKQINQLLTPSTMKPIIKQN